MTALQQWKSTSPDSHSLCTAADLIHSANDKGRKESRINLHKALQPTKATVKDLLQDWLTTSQKGNGQY